MICRRQCSPGQERVSCLGGPDFSHGKETEREADTKVDAVIRERVTHRDCSSETALALNLKEEVKRDSRFGFLALRFQQNSGERCVWLPWRRSWSEACKDSLSGRECCVTYHAYTSQTALPSLKGTKWRLAVSLEEPDFSFLH